MISRSTPAATFRCAHILSRPGVWRFPSRTRLPDAFTTEVPRGMIATRKRVHVICHVAGGDNKVDRVAAMKLSGPPQRVCAVWV